MKTRVRDLIQQGDKLFTKKAPFDSLCQTIAENFYPERADFTTTRSLGEEFAANLMSGFPVLARRDLANALSSMLRPPGEKWFHARTTNEKINEDAAALTWLDRASDVLRDLMYERRSQFIRAMKQGDNDFAAFGQCVIQPEMNKDRDGILYRAWHLRDVAWCENAELEVDVVHRNWKLEARQLVKLFPKTVSPIVQKAAEKEPYREFKCRHIILPADQYDYNQSDAPRRKLPTISLYIDTENDTILEETPVPSNDYVIPRWVTVSGSQYAYAPTTVIALADARMLQQIGLTLLEAGQKAVDPPKVAAGEVISGGVNSYAGGVTWIDSDYDERTGDAIRDMPIDTRGLNFGVAVQERAQAMITEAFYLNKINLPEAIGGEKMTATETQERIKQYIRQALPLFEPMESEFNGGICEKSFEIALRMRAFGSEFDMPPILRNQPLRFQFESPLRAATGRAKVAAFSEAAQLLQTAALLDPAVRHDIDIDKSFRDAALGTGMPAEWLRPEEDAQALKDQDRQAQAAQAERAQQLGDAAQQAQVANVASSAAKNLKGAGLLGPTQGAAA